MLPRWGYTLSNLLNLGSIIIICTFYYYTSALLKIILLFYNTGFYQIILLFHSHLLLACYSLVSTCKAKCHKQWKTEKEEKNSDPKCKNNAAHKGAWLGKMKISNLVNKREKKTKVAAVMIEMDKSLRWCHSFCLDETWHSLMLIDLSTLSPLFPFT